MSRVVSVENVEGLLPEASKLSYTVLPVIVMSMHPDESRGCAGCACPYVCDFMIKPQQPHASNVQFLTSPNISETASNLKATHQTTSPKFKPQERALHLILEAQVIYPTSTQTKKCRFYANS